jgi:hypothetical protein
VLKLRGRKPKAIAAVKIQRVHDHAGQGGPAWHGARSLASTLSISSGKQHGTLIKAGSSSRCVRPGLLRQTR